jgi:WD40 repeat protein
MAKLLNTIAIGVIALIANCAIAYPEEPPVQQPQLRIEAGMHTGVIRGIDVSADGRLLVTGSDDKTVRLWSLPEGRLLKILRVPMGRGFGGKIFAVAISPDGRTVAAGGWDAYRSQNENNHFVYLFDTVSGGLAKRLGPLPNVVVDLAFSPGAERLAAGLGGKNGVRVWTAPFDGEPMTDSGYGDSIYGLAFDRSGSGRFATTSWDGMIRLYDRDLALAPETATAPGGKYPLRIAFSPDGDTLAVGYGDTTNVDLLSVPNLVRVHAVETGFAGNGDLGKVAWSADGGSLYASGSYDDGTGYSPVLRWAGSGQGMHVALDGPHDSITELAVLPLGGVAFGSADPAFGIFDADGKRRLFQGPVTADMRVKRDGHFRGAPDATGVWFGLKVRSGDSWLFDAGRLTFEKAPEPPADYIAPVTSTLNIANWTDQTGSTLDRQALGLGPQEIARSLAIAPDAKSFILGAEWSIYRFDAEGRQMWSNSVEGLAWGVNLSADGSIVVAALGDGTIRWYRASDGAELLAFFVHVPDKRWIAWTPSGYYAASPGAEDLIGWHVNGKAWDDSVDFFPASRFRDRFYRPDIVQLVLQMRDEQRAIAEANTRAKRKMEETSVRSILPAVVKIIADPRGVETDRPEVTLTYRLRSPSGRPITKLEVRIDDRPIDTRAATPLDDEDHEIAVSLPAHDAEVSLIAYVGEQPSAPAKIAVKWTGKAGAGKPKLFALVIGVSAYDDTSLSLGYAAKDASDFEAALEAQKGRFYGDVEVVALLDKDASKSAIETGLAKLRRKAGPQDFVIVFMAGHGVTDSALDFYYLPADGSRDPLLYDANNVSGLVINNMLSKIPGKVLLFLDTCRAGRAASSAGRVDMQKAANDMAQGGLVVFASSTGDQDSLESAEWSNGAFTRAMLQTLADAKAYGEDGELSIFELAEQLSSRVRTLTGGRQAPVLANYGPLFTLAALR